MPERFESSQMSLPIDSRRDALKKLFDHQRETENYLNEQIPIFQYYINIALNNIQSICFENQRQMNGVFDWEPIIAELSQKDEAHYSVLNRLANFLWLFQVDKPENEFGKEECRQLTLEIVKRMYMLRNFLCHLEEKGIDALVFDNTFYLFFSEFLGAVALRHATAKGLKSADLFKMKLMLFQEICKEYDTSLQKDVIHYDQSKYALTRKGLIFFICLALWRDEAIEFCQSLRDMELLRRDVEEELSDYSEEKREEFKKGLIKKGGKRRALHTFFSHFSMRRSYNKVESEDHDYTCFTNIIEYLNKVPTIAWDYLSLKKERDRMKELSDASNESEELKQTRYTLHRRQKERSLSLLAAYCEDFGLFPSIHFKRMDVSENFGRQRYCFGMENGNDCRQNRHYAILDEAIRFEYRPTAHYGSIHIDALRSAISLDELRRLVIAQTVFRGDRTACTPAVALEKYFEAYHRILEKSLCEESHDFIDRQGYLEDLMTVTGGTREELMNDDSFRVRMATYFPVNLTRFFIPQENIPSDSQLVEMLKKKIQSEINEDARLAKALDIKHDRSLLPLEQRGPLPDECRFSDGTLIHAVFRAINRYLAPERKYRQLPRMQKHRGEKDTEYQRMHKIIGKYSTDSKMFWNALKGEEPIMEERMINNRRKTIQVGSKKLADDKCRPELRVLARRLEPVEKKFNWGRSLKLEALARASLECDRKFCQEHLDALSRVCSHEELLKQCQLFGVRIGMPLGLEALVKTILNIDLRRWVNAFNYQDHAPFVNRDLTSFGHVVTQVPLHNGFTKKHCMAYAKARPYQELFKEGVFQFGRALEMRMNTHVELRDFYDSDSLFACRQENALLTNTRWEANLPAELCSEEEIPGRCKFFQAGQKLDDIRFQDLLLLYAAMQYHRRYEQRNNAVRPIGNALANLNSVYGYFSGQKVERMAGGLQIVSYPNDRLRFMYAILKKNAGDLAKTYSANELATPMSYYDVASKLRRIMAKDRRIRLELMPLLWELESKVKEPTRPQGVQNEEWRHVLYECYLRYVRGNTPEEKRGNLSEEAFNRLVEIRNQCFHEDYLNLAEEIVKEGKEILSLFGIKETLFKPSRAPNVNRHLTARSHAPRNNRRNGNANRNSQWKPRNNPNKHS